MSIQAFTAEAIQILTNMREKLDCFEITRTEYETAKSALMEDMGLQLEIITEPMEVQP